MATREQIQQYAEDSLMATRVDPTEGADDTGAMPIRAIAVSCGAIVASMALGWIAGGYLAGLAGACIATLAVGVFIDPILAWTEDRT